MRKPDTHIPCLYIYTYIHVISNMDNPIFYFYKLYKMSKISIYNLHFAYVLYIISISGFTRSST